jgi:hypothetical protein
MDIDRYKIKLNSFTAELEQPIDRDKRLFITTEADCYDVSTPSNEDGTFDQVYKCKTVGSTIVREGGEKPKEQISKSKRTQSQKLRVALWSMNPSEEFYQCITDKIIANIESVVEFLKNK